MLDSSLEDDTRSVKPILVRGATYYAKELKGKIGKLPGGDDTWTRWEDAFWEVVQADVPPEDRRELVSQHWEQVIEADDLFAVWRLPPSKIPEYQPRYKRKPPRYHITSSKQAKSKSPAKKKRPKKRE